jgi:hypothetical protein
LARFIISGILPYDGEYELDLAYFTNREWHLIRNIAGVYPPDLMYALAQRDAGCIVALGLIVLDREGHEDVERDLLWDAPAGKMTLDLTPPEEEGGSPLAEKIDSSDEPSETSPGANTESSGADSPNDGETSQTDRSDIGDPG